MSGIDSAKGGSSVTGGSDVSDGITFEHPIRAENNMIITAFEMEDLSLSIRSVLKLITTFFR
jgi:hypothetical protein